MISNIGSSDRVGHKQGKLMAVLEFDRQHVMPKMHHDTFRTTEASAFEKAADSFLNRQLSTEKHKHLGKKMVSGGWQSVNLFEKYGSFPPPPAKPPNVHDFSEEYLLQFCHTGHEEVREEQVQKMATAQSLFDRNVGVSVEDRLYAAPWEKHAAKQEKIQQEKKFGSKAHGMLDDLIRNDDAREGKKMVTGHMSPVFKDYGTASHGLLDPLVAERADWVASHPAGKKIVANRRGETKSLLGGAEPSSSLRPKSLPILDYDPLGLKTGGADTHTDKPFGKPKQIHHFDDGENTKKLMTHNPKEVSTVPPTPPRCLKHFQGKLPTVASSFEVIRGFRGMGTTPMPPEVERIPGLKHVKPEDAKPTPAPHRLLPLYASR